MKFNEIPYSVAEAQTILTKLGINELGELSRWCYDFFMNYDCIIAGNSAQQRFEEPLMAIFCLGRFIGYNEATNNKTA